jgi:polysaccharide export outer membrane protein
MKLRFLFFSALTFFFYSCVSTPKNIVYFQDLEKYSEQENVYSLKNYEPTIRVEDQLTIGVAAPIPNQEAVAQFNAPANNYLMPGETMTQRTQTTQIYTVDVDGNIDFPVIGKMKLAGLTKKDAVSLLKEKVGAHIPNPVIYLQIISFKVTVLGEVLTPGQISVSDEKISILDAIGAAGDLTIYGNRENVLLIRDNNGKKEFAQFDLTKADIFSSPYYYLQQNDVIVVEPNKSRMRESRYGQSASYQLSIINAVVGTISVLTSAAVAIYSISRK